MKSVGFDLWGEEELLPGLLALLQIPSRPSNGSRNTEQGWQSFAFLPYEPLGFQVSIVNASGLQAEKHRLHLLKEIAGAVIQDEKKEQGV